MKHRPFPHGIPDECFTRGKVPMTGAEVRAVSLSKLALNVDSIVYDIGAGTGSVTVEAALTAGAGMVYAIERKPAAQALIRENIKKFGIANSRLVTGEAPGCLSPLPAPDRVFIGGSGGNLREIIEFIDHRLDKRGRVVMNAVTVESVYNGILLLEEKGYQVGAVNVSCSRLRKTGEFHMWQAGSPVTVIWGVKEDE